MKRLLLILLLPALLLCGCARTAGETVAQFREALNSFAYEDWAALYPPAYLENVCREEFGGRREQYRAYADGLLKSAETEFEKKYGENTRTTCSYTLAPGTENDLLAVRDLLTPFCVERSSVTAVQTAELSCKIRSGTAEGSESVLLILLEIGGEWYLCPGCQSLLP